MIGDLYKEIYRLGGKISKRDKLGIHTKIENICLEILALGIESALRTPATKKIAVEALRIKTEILKHIIRSEFEIGVIQEKSYISLQNKLQEISKMTNGWLKYLTQKEPGGSF